MYKFPSLYLETEIDLSFRNDRLCLFPLKFECHLIFCVFVESPKKELQLLLHFLMVQSGQRGVEREAVGKKRGFTQKTA